MFWNKKKSEFCTCKARSGMFQDVKNGDGICCMDCKLPLNQEDTLEFLSSEPGKAITGLMRVFGREREGGTPHEREFVGGLKEAFDLIEEEDKLSEKGGK